MFRSGIHYERFYEPELELRRSNDKLTIALIFTFTLVPVVLLQLY